MAVVQEIVAKIDRLDGIRLKSSAQQGNNYQSEEKAYKIGRNNCLVSHSSDKGFIFRIYF
jgi:hypothetical protein